MVGRLHRYVVAPIRDFIFPPVCLTCDERLHEDGDLICRSCWSLLNACRIGFASRPDTPRVFVEEGIIKDFISCYYFETDSKLQDLIHLLKYQGFKSIGRVLGREVGKKILLDPLLAGADRLIPVPLHKVRQRDRGYNQSDFICRGISDVTHIPVDTLVIVRRKNTQSQTQLNMNERKENVQDAFKIKAGAEGNVAGKTFILVDDVITTGSTIAACARELQAHGATAVMAGSLALAS